MTRAGIDPGLFAPLVEPGERVGELRRARARRDRAGPGRSRWSPSAPTTRPRRWSGCRPRATGSPTSPPAPGRWSGVELDRARAHRGEPGGQLLQRAGRRRHRPLPAQRDGPVAAAGVPARRGATPEPGAAAGRRGRASPAPAAVVDAGDPAFIAPGDMPARIAAACAAARPGRARDRGRDRALRPGQPRARPPAHGPRGAPRCPGARSTWCTSSAAAPATPCCASSPPTPAGCRWWPGRSRPRRWATRWCRPGRWARCRGGLAELRALLRAHPGPRALRARGRPVRLGRRRPAARPLTGRGRLLAAEAPAGAYWSSSRRAGAAGRSAHTSASSAGSSTSSIRHCGAGRRDAADHRLADRIATPSPRRARSTTALGRGWPAARCPGAARGRRRRGRTRRGCRCPAAGRPPGTRSHRRPASPCARRASGWPSGTAATRPLADDGERVEPVRAARRRRRPGRGRPRRPRTRSTSRSELSSSRLISMPGCAPVERGQRVEQRGHRARRSPCPTVEPAADQPVDVVDRRAHGGRRGQRGPGVRQRRLAGRGERRACGPTGRTAARRARARAGGSGRSPRTG